ncbi:uncharacterized protein LOC124898416 [Capsicum annuum]|uniref:uncharacterized protein LOC124898416 n=1 Tax=Capsicum annuum TaxID=4072 RepID=UPI001FB11B61|nr:uncharacterized protein LOC124898416 [Capsicum annuum]
MDATTWRLQSLFYWKSLLQDVRSFVQQYDICQRNKYNAAAYLGYLKPLPIRKGVWTDVCLDFIKGLPKSNGKDVILVVVDRLSKYGHFLCLHHPYTTQSIAQCYLDHVFKLHGILVTMTSDRDLVFLSSFWQERFTLQRVQLQRSTTYHPQTDGQTEDKRHCCKHRTDRSFSVGDWVYLKLQPYRQVTVATRPSNKLAAKYYGPYIVDAWIGVVAYRLLLPKDVLIHPTFHVSKLKKCYAIPMSFNHLPVLHLCSPFCPEPELVLDRRMVKHGIKAIGQVLVKWTDLDTAQATWEYVSGLHTRFPAFHP